jgi:hypothetical protein
MIFDERTIEVEELNQQFRSKPRMKTAYCLECEKTREVPDWCPDPCICEECCGPWFPRAKSGHGIILHYPRWAFLRCGPGCTKEKLQALDATQEAKSEAGWRKFWDDYYEKLTKAVLDAYVAN